MSAVGDLVAATARLADRLAGASPAWWASRPGGSMTRREILRALLEDLAALGVTAGSGQPRDAVVPVLGDYAIADQLLVLTNEIAVTQDEAAAASALSIVVLARAAIEAR